MKYRVVLGMAFAVAIAMLMVPVGARAFQSENRSSPSPSQTSSPSESESPSQIQGQIPASERNEVSERERNLGTNNPAVTPDNTGELSGARSPGSLPETPARSSVSWASLFGGLVIGAIIGFLIGRANPAVQLGSRDRAA
jgi:hypothetical protein